MTKKVLLIDDDKFLLDMYGLKFSKAGYDVRTCDSTESGLKTIKDGFEPDVLLVDIIMPGMDGLQFMEIVRKEGLSPNAKVIFLTNQGEPEDISRAKALNVEGYIVKATTIPSDVLAEVERVLSANKI